MSKAISMDTARAAKEALRKESAARHWSVGFVRRGGILGLKVNVPTAAERALVPARVSSVPVHQVDVVPEVVALSSRQHGSVAERSSR